MAGPDDIEDGDLVSAPPKVHVPAEVEEAVRTLIRWAGTCTLGGAETRSPSSMSSGPAIVSPSG
jgi:hypothetical protein